MTPKQMIQRANSVRVMFGLCNAPGDVVIYLSKKEARRLVDQHGLPDDEIGTVHLNDAGVCSILFAT